MMNVEQGMMNFERIPPFNIQNSLLSIQYSLLLSTLGGFLPGKMEFQADSATFAALKEDLGISSKAAGLFRQPGSNQIETFTKWQDS